MLAFYLLYVYEEKDEPQFVRLVERYNEDLLKASYGILKKEQDAEDAVQNTWIAIAQNMHVLRNLDEEKTEIYIYKTVKNQSINIYNKKKNEADQLDVNVLNNIPTDTDVQSEYAIREEWNAVLSCLENMNHYYRDVLTLYYLYEMKPIKISETLARPLQTVKSQLQRGKRLLKEAMGEWHHD